MIRYLPLFLLLFSPLCFGSMNLPDVAVGSWARAGKDHALFIAVDDYANWSDLRYPVKDVGRIAVELEQRYGFTTETLANPTRLQILDKLTEYRNRRFAKDGQLLVFFSGHGDFANATSEGFFIPRDGLKRDPYQDSYVALSRLKRAVNAIPCDHILLAIDACYSGALDDRIAIRANDDPPRFGRPGGNGGMSQAEIDQLVWERLRTKTRLYFTSGGLEQTPDWSQFVDQFLTALGPTSLQEPILDYNGLRYFLGKARPTPRTGVFDGNKPGTNDFLFVCAFANSIPQPDTERIRADLADWRVAQAQDNCAAYRRYLQKHPYGDFATRARQKIAPCEAEERMMAAWQTAKTRNDCDSYTAFAKDYFQSPYTSLVPDKLNALGCERAAEVDNMIFIPGGTFQMGNQFGDGSSNEKPVHAVILSDFYLSRTELMVGEFADFIEATGYTTTAEKEGDSYIWTGSKYEKKTGVTWLDDTKGENRPTTAYNHPVIHVSWYDAVAYCNWLSGQHCLTPVYRINGTMVTPNWSADGYRLPTEAEWEYAARSGGKKEKWAGTSTESGLTQFANYYGKEDSYDRTAPVGMLRANNLGLADMSGNVWEWCYTDYYGKSPSSNPRGPDTGSNRVIRGGSWFNTPVNCRAADRISYGPSGRINDVGFRLARSSR